jgi:hypothetical protein
MNFDQPEIIIDAVRQLVAMARNTSHHAEQRLDLRQ